MRLSLQGGDCTREAEVAAGALARPDKKEGDLRLVYSYKNDWERKKKWEGTKRKKYRLVHFTFPSLSFC